MVWLQEVAERGD